ncbi:MAG: GDP-mannose 4,6-dehydratase [candidate division KSB1 bacterium]|nr:GDP-mannose 4,6-dehydratase [candidate division KSB1 bacterium]MDZ7334018.1 GDP-mannose 4,6-dehydratase [candidate division KSB1 bacterium]MDZ7357453.1 GDP-mannose 4,6-dehydratase [candidate division KSB1 bacterium]MDZ7400003.1 GDP-mannose 4,6-dehydratase [candidate division KSB1 bacterium]
MYYFVTGGAGFIGSHLIERLLAENHHVWCLDNFNDYYPPEMKQKNLEVAQSHANFKLIQGDILDERLLTDIFQSQQFDGIIHLAARAGVRPSVQQPKLYEEVNVRGTLNLLEIARVFQVQKFIMASSSSVYGNNRKVPFSEDDPVDQPISPYAATKKAAELIGYTYWNLFNISVTCLRFFTVYGPRQRPDMAIHKFTRLIANDEEIPIYGDGSAQRDFTFISDIIEGVVRSIERCQGYHIYNLGDSRVVSLMQLLNLIEQNLGKRAKIKYLPAQPGDVRITYADIQKATDDLGYRPLVPIEQGIAAFVEWFLQYDNHFGSARSSK